MTPTPRRCLVLAAATLAAGLLAAAPAVAVGVDPAPIGPGQFFTGLVNGNGTSTGTAEPAVIKMVCPGPIVAGETGHPLAGQTVAALPASVSSGTVAGYTGSAADRIDVDFGVPATTAPVTLTDWAVPAAIPTSLLLPCSGTGTVAFVPDPTSPTARTATVTVLYADIAD
jgi:hypothetical protein